MKKYSIFTILVFLVSMVAQADARNSSKGNQKGFAQNSGEASEGIFTLIKHRLVCHGASYFLNTNTTGGECHSGLGAGGATAYCDDYQFDPENQATANCNQGCVDEGGSATCCCHDHSPGDDNDICAGQRRCALVDQ